jgi:TatD DNase family protein
MNRCCALGFYLSFGGPITYRNARQAAEIVPKAPEERLLLETDSPYLAPHPHRGKRNEPALVTLVAEKMAELRGDSLDHIVEITGQNATKLFRLEVPPA